MIFRMSGVFIFFFSISSVSHPISVGSSVPRCSQALQPSPPPSCHISPPHAPRAHFPNLSSDGQAHGGLSFSLTPSSFSFLLSSPPSSLLPPPSSSFLLPPSSSFLLLPPPSSFPPFSYFL
jgi:hypothetical protein